MLRPVTARVDGSAHADPSPVDRVEVVAPLGGQGSEAARTNKACGGFLFSDALPYKLIVARYWP